MGNRGVGAGDQARRAVGSDRNHPVPEQRCSRPGVLVSKGAAHVGAETIGPFGTFAASWSGRWVMTPPVLLSMTSPVSVLTVWGGSGLR